MQLSSALRSQTLRELGLVRFRLMGDEPVLYGNVDRTRAEAELCLAVALPLLAIGVVLAFRVNSSIWAALALAGGVAVVAGILLWQASAREQRANDALVDAMFINKVQPPALDQLRRATDDIEKETADQRSERKKRQAALREKQLEHEEARARAVAEYEGGAGPYPC